MTADQLKSDTETSRDPVHWYPLRLNLETIYFFQKFGIGAVKVLVHDYHVEILPVGFLHLTSFLDDVFELIILDTLESN